MGQRAARALLTVLVPRGMMKKRMWLCQSGGLLLSNSTYGRSIELRKESEPQRPTFMTVGGAMLVLQYFCSLVTRQVRVARTSAGPAVQMT